MSIDDYDSREADRYYDAIDNNHTCPVCEGSGKIYYHYHLNSFVPCTREEYETAISRDPNRGGYWEECDNCDGTGIA